MKLAIKELTVPLLLLAIFLFQATQLALWVAEDTSNPAWDQSGHAMKSLNFYRQLTGTSPLTTEEIESVYPRILYMNNYYPPLLPASTLPFYFILGESYDPALMADTLFLGILIVSAFLLGRKLRGNETGLIMALVVSTVPIYSRLMKDYLIDFPLSAMVMLGLLSLVYTKNFENFRYSLLFGVVFGLGMLTKWTFFLFLIVPLCVSVFYFVKKNVFKKKDFTKMRNLLIPVIIAAALILIWYLPRHEFVSSTLSASVGMGLAKGDPVFGSFEGIMYYIYGIIGGFSIIYLALFILGSVVLFRSKKWGKLHTALIAEIILVYMVFTAISNKDYRFIAPIYTFMAIFACTWIAGISDKRIKYGVTIFVVVVAITAYPLISAKVYLESDTLDIDEILSVMDSDANREFSVCVIAETATLNDANIPYYAFSGRYPVFHMAGNGCSPLNFNYVIVGPIEETWRSGIFYVSMNILIRNMNQFKEIYHSENVYVYKRL